MAKALSDCTSIIFNVHLDNKCLWSRSGSKWKHHMSELMLLYGYLRKGIGSISVLGYKYNRPHVTVIRKLMVARGN
jgi:hypothetical protein